MFELFLVILVACTLGNLASTTISAFVTTWITGSRWYVKWARKVTNKYMEEFLKEES